MKTANNKAAPTGADGSQTRLPAQRLRLASALMLPALLAGCASVALPPWVPAQAPVAAPRASTTAPGTALPSAAAPQPAPPVAVQVTPVPPPGASLPPPASIGPALPYSTAVAARFPAPAVVYSTPGLQPGRTTLSSPAEVGSWLREQAASALRGGEINAQVMPIGRSQRGEAIEALVLTRGIGTDAAALQASARPTVLLLSQQQGDEPAGSEALLVLARELSQGLLRPLLANINVVMVPRTNPDGAEAGTAATANGTDLDRDHLLLNTPEAQAIARLVRDTQPAVVLDAHEYPVGGQFLEKFGAIPKHDALVQYATSANLPEFLTKAAEEWYRRPMLTALRAQGLGVEWHHTTSGDPLDKKVSMGGVRPDTSRNVNGLKNTISLLVESRGVGLGRTDIQRRVHAQVTAIASVLSSTGQRHSELAQLLPYVDKEVAAMACTAEAVVEAAPTPSTYPLVMLDPATGADKTLTVDWESSLALTKTRLRTRPCGYVLSSAAATAVERLRLHGVQVQRVTEPGAVLADTYRESARSAGTRQDARAGLADASANPIAPRVDVTLTRGLVDVPRGSFYIPMNQPLGNIALAALEPDAPSSFFANALLPEVGSVNRVMAPHSMKVEDLP